MKGLVGLDKGALQQVIERCREEHIAPCATLWISFGRKSPGYFGQQSMEDRRRKVSVVERIKPFIERVFAFIQERILRYLQQRSGSLKLGGQVLRKCSSRILGSRRVVTRDPGIARSLTDGTDVATQKGC